MFKNKRYTIPQKNEKGSSKPCGGCDAGLKKNTIPKIEQIAVIIRE